MSMGGGGHTLGILNNTHTQTVTVCPCARVSVYSRARASVCNGLSRDFKKFLGKTLLLFEQGSYTSTRPPPARTAICGAGVLLL
jgi:hypothetical protein